MDTTTPFSSDRPDWQLTFTYSFFGGQLRQINPKEANQLSRAYWDAGRLYKRSKADKISFPNGDIIKHGSREFGGNRCGNNYSYTLEKRDRSGDFLLNKMLFLLYDNPASTKIWSACSIVGDLDRYTGFADALYPTFVPLEDGTFLAVDFELVIRL